MPRSLPLFVLPAPASLSLSVASREKCLAGNDLIAGLCPYSVADHLRGVYTP